MYVAPFFPTVRPVVALYFLISNKQKKKVESCRRLAVSYFSHRPPSYGIHCHALPPLQLRLSDPHLKLRTRPAPTPKALTLISLSPFSFLFPIPHLQRTRFNWSSLPGGLSESFQLRCASVSVSLLDLEILFFIVRILLDE